jgi:CHAD domain-containing protein
MAKAHRIPGLSASDPYAAAAVKIIRVRVRELIDHAGGVLDVNDIERVHDMRVATRRLRAVLEIFEPCFPRGELKAALRQVRALADALGERRDRDVAIAALEDVAASMPGPDRTGIETLIATLRVEQAEANEALARFVGADHLPSIVDQLSALVAGVEATWGGSHAASTDVVEILRQESPHDGVRARAAGGGV